MGNVVEFSRDGVDRSLVAAEGDYGVPRFLTGVVELHLAHGSSGLLLDEVRVEEELFTIRLEQLVVAVDVGFAFRFEIDDVDGAVVAFDEVDGAVDDVIGLGKANLHLCFHDVIPSAGSPFDVASDLPFRGINYDLAQVSVLARGECLVVRLEPIVRVLQCDAVAFAPQRRTVHVLDRLVHKLAEKSRAHTNWGEAELAKELVLHGTPLVEGDVRRERIDGLEVALLHVVEGELVERERVGIAGGQLAVGLLERLADLPGSFSVCENEQVLGTRERGVVEPPEVEVLDGVDGLICLSSAVAVLDALEHLVAGLRWRRVERIHNDNGELHPLRLMDGQEGHATARHVFRLVFILVNAT